MRLCISARGVGLEGLEHLEKWLRLLLGSWTCRIRQAKVFLEDLNGRRSGRDVRCTVEAALIPSGKVTVQGLGIDAETAVREASRRLLRRVKREFYGRRVGVGIEKRTVRSISHVDLSGTGEEGG